jgi:kynureninase
LNSGPGSPAFIYINRKHFHKQPLMAGWFGYVKEKQFDMLLDFEHQKGAGGWQISSPGILGAAAVEGALRITLEAGIDRIREKSLHMTDYLIYLIQHILAPPPYHFTVVTPTESHRRGGHVALCREEESYRISLALRDRGFVPDFRPPNILRIAPVALYNTYLEVWQAVQAIKRIIDEKSVEKYPAERKSIT